MYSSCKLHRISNIFTRKGCFKFCPPNFYTKQIVFPVHTSRLLFDVNNAQKTDVLVYEAPLKTRVKYVKILSLSSSMLGFAVFPAVMNDLVKVNVFLAVAAGAISTIFLATPLMLHWITKRYVLELHYNIQSQVFTAKTYNLISQIKEIKFKAAEVTVPDLPGMLTSFLVNGKSLFVDANMIQNPDAYSHMMGYDKPFDFAIKIDEKDENPKS